MSSSGNENTVKESYKSVVKFKEEPVEQIVKHGIEYDSLAAIMPLVYKDMQKRDALTARHNITPCVPLPVKYFMTDMTTVLGDLTNEVQYAYEVKGIANDLKLTDVMVCFENCIKVSCGFEMEHETASNTDEDSSPLS